MMDKLTYYPKALYREGCEVLSLVTGEASHELAAMSKEYKIYKIARFALGLVAVVAAITAIILIVANPISLMTLGAINGVVMSIALAYISHQRMTGIDDANLAKTIKSNNEYGTNFRPRRHANPHHRRSNHNNNNNNTSSYPDFCQIYNNSSGKRQTNRRTQQSNYNNSNNDQNMNGSDSDDSSRGVGSTSQYPRHHQTHQNTGTYPNNSHYAHSRNTPASSSSYPVSATNAHAPKSRYPQNNTYMNDRDFDDDDDDKVDMSFLRGNHDIDDDGQSNFRGFQAQQLAQTHNNNTNNKK